MKPFVHRKGVDKARSGPSSAAGFSTPPRSLPVSSCKGRTTRAQRLEQRMAAAKQRLDAVKGPIEKLVGEVTESTPDHKIRHWPFLWNCPRCHWIKKGEEFCQKYGRVHAKLIPLTGEFWLQPRQPRRGGHWALGCAVCALLNEAYTSGMDIPYESAKHERKSRIFDTKWTRYEIRAIDLTKLREHARSDQYLRALR